MKLLGFFTVILLLSSCAENVDEITANSQTREAKVIFQSQCLNCHSSGNTSPDLSTDLLLSNNINLAIDETQSDRMPQGSTLEANEKEQLISWFKTFQTDLSSSSSGLSSSTNTSSSGIATNSSSSNSLSSSTIELSSSSFIDTDLDNTNYAEVENIISTHCIKCHGPTSKNIKLTSYENVKDGIDQIIIETESGAMPKGQNTFENSDLLIIKAWMNEGFPL